MKKTTFLLIIAPFLFVGCSENSFESTSSPVAIEEASFEAPERQPDIFGTVKSMIGNEIVVSVRDVSSLPEEVLEIQKKMAEARGTSGGRMPGMGGGGGSGGGTLPEGITQADMTKMREAMANVKTIDHNVLFPVGIPMAIRIREDGTMRYEDASLEDVTGGKSVSVWLADTGDDRKVAEVVTIGSGRGQ